MYHVLYVENQWDLNVCYHDRMHCDSAVGICNRWNYDAGSFYNIHQKRNCVDSTRKRNEDAVLDCRSFSRSCYFNIRNFPISFLYHGVTMTDTNNHYNCSLRTKLAGFDTDHCRHPQARWIWCINALKHNECPEGFKL